MNNRVQPDSNPPRLVEPRASGAPDSSRTPSIDALFAQALASVAASFAPGSMPVLNGVPTTLASSAPTERSEAKRKLTEPESRDAALSRSDTHHHEPGVLEMNTPMSAAQHARQELRRASDSGVADSAPTLSDPAPSDAAGERPGQGVPATMHTASQSEGGRGEPQPAGQAKMRQEAANPSGATRSNGSSGSDNTSNQSRGQNAGSSSSSPQNVAVTPLATTTHSAGTPSDTQAVASAGGKVEAAGGAVSGAAAAKSDPMAALGALGARSSRVRFTTEVVTNQATPRSASLPDQVARGLATLLRHQGGSVTIRLTPETLGKIKINLKIEDAHVWATFQPSSDASHEAIDQSLASLRSSLESRGLIVERLEVVPSGVANFEQSLRDSNHQSSSSGEQRPSEHSDPNMADSQSGSQPETGGSGRGFGDQGSTRAAGIDGPISSPDTELLPDSIGSASLFMEESSSESGMARRLRLDAVA